MADNTANIGFEKQIWDAACVLRGNIDASEYKWMFCSSKKTSTP